MGTPADHVSRSVRRRAAAAAATLVAMAVLLVGCAGGGSSLDSGPQVGPAPAPGQVADSRGGAPAPEPAAVPGGGEAGKPYADGTGRQIARTASLTLVVDDVRGTADRIRAVAGAMEGWIEYESLQLDDANRDGSQPAGSWLTLSVPASRLDAATDQVAALGTVRNRGASAQDLTEVVVDLDARIRSLEASVARLQELVGRAGSVADIAAVERELSNRQAELESLSSQRLRLAGAVERATLTVALLTPSQSTTTNPIQTGWSRGWTAFLESLATLITVLAAALPFVLFAGLVALPIVWWRRRASAGEGRRGRRMGAGQQERADGDPAGQHQAQARPEQTVHDEDQGHGGEDGDQVLN